MLDNYRDMEMQKYVSYGSRRCAHLLVRSPRSRRMRFPNLFPPLPP